MARDREFEGKDLEQALNLAATELGMAEPDLDYEIVEQGRPGLFGIGTKNVRIRIIPPVETAVPDRQEQPEKRAPRRRRGRNDRKREKRAERKAEPKPEPKEPFEPSPEAESARATVQQMLELMGLDVQTSVKPTDQGLGLQFDGPDRKMLSQKDGELASALQFLLNRMSRRAWPGVGRILLHTDGRRETRDEDLIALAKDAARQVSKSGRSKRLRQMNAYERRLVHMTIREMRGMGSRSEGDGYLKRVRIFKQKNSGGK